MERAQTYKLASGLLSTTEPFVITRFICMRECRCIALVGFDPRNGSNAVRLNPCPGHHLLDTASRLRDLVEMDDEADGFAESVASVMEELG